MHYQEREQWIRHKVRVRKGSKYTKVFHIVTAGRRREIIKDCGWNEEGEEHYQEGEQWIWTVIRVR